MRQPSAREVGRRRFLREATVFAAAVAATEVGIVRLDDSNKSLQITYASIYQQCADDFVPKARKQAQQEGYEVTLEDEQRAAEVCNDILQRRILDDENILEPERLKRLGNTTILLAGAVSVATQTVRGMKVALDRFQSKPKMSRRKFIKSALLVSGMAAVGAGGIEALTMPSTTDLPEAQAASQQRKLLKQRIEERLTDGTLVTQPLVSPEEQVVFQQVVQAEQAANDRYTQEQMPVLRRDIASMVTGFIAVAKGML